MGTVLHCLGLCCSLYIIIFVVLLCTLFPVQYRPVETTALCFVPYPSGRCAGAGAGLVNAVAPDGEALLKAKEMARVMRDQGELDHATSCTLQYCTVQYRTISHPAPESPVSGVSWRRIVLLKGQQA